MYTERECKLRLCYFQHNTTVDPIIENILFWKKKLGVLLMSSANDLFISYKLGECVRVHVRVRKSDWMADWLCDRIKKKRGRSAVSALFFFLLSFRHPIYVRSSQFAFSINIFLFEMDHTFMVNSFYRRFFLRWWQFWSKINNLINSKKINDETILNQTYNSILLFLFLLVLVCKKINWNFVKIEKKRNINRVYALINVQYFFFPSKYI